jgi:uncharacterized protein
VELTGERLIAAPRMRVWESLNDPKILERCIPGCEEVVRLSDTRFEAKLLTRIGPLRARFSGHVEMSDIDAPSGCTVLFEGAAGSVGMAHGQSKLTLEEAAEGTRLRYAAEAAIGGKLGQVGSRLIDASVQKLADDFFRSLNDELNPQKRAPAASAAAPLEPVLAMATATESPRETVTPQKPLWSTGWSGELQRLFWFALGALTGGLIARLLPF